MRYRRARIAGGTYFFTVVTYHRQKILCVPENVNVLREAFREVMKQHFFAIDAFVLLPDHLHCIWTLPKDDADYSTRWRLVKSCFSRKCDPKYQHAISASRKRKNERAIWQRRFWEHTIRNDPDFDRHADYIHYNPVKHGLAARALDWPYSSFHRFVARGDYSKNWAGGLANEMNDPRIEPG